MTYKNIDKWKLNHKPGWRRSPNYWGLWHSPGKTCQGSWEGDAPSDAKEIRPCGDMERPNQAPGWWGCHTCQRNSVPQPISPGLGQNEVGTVERRPTGQRALHYLLLVNALCYLTSCYLNSSGVCRHIFFSYSFILIYILFFIIRLP